jgi:uncharacterized membrane protein YgaE (UPF0421/DUF939 family)
MSETDIPHAEAAPANLWIRVTGFAHHVIESTLLSRMGGGLHLGVLTAMAALGAYLPTKALGINEGFWSAMTAIAVVQTEFHAAETTARDQFAGAAIGGSIALGMVLAFGGHLIVYAIAVILSAITCWAINLPTASRLSATTSTIVMLVPHTGPPELMMASRLGEVAWGVCVAVFLVWIAARVPKNSVEAFRDKEARIAGVPHGDPTKSGQSD